jgi:hypothetical protein
MQKFKFKAFLSAFAILLFVGGVFFGPTPIVIADGPTNVWQDSLLQTQLQLCGGDILHVLPEVDADDSQLELITGGGTYLRPQITDLFYEKDIDFDLEESVPLMYGMDSAQYDHEFYINDSVDTGVKVEETGGNGDPVETTAFSMGDTYGYGKVTLNADSGDTYAGYSYEMDVFHDVDNDGVKDDNENEYLSDFDENGYVMIGMKGDWSNVSATALDNVVECDLTFTTSGTDFELESHITADADGNTAWSNFDDGSADNKASFLYANADNQFVSFYYDLTLMDNYDEDDYSTWKGLDKITFRNIGYGDSGTSEQWVYYIVFIKNPSVWNYGTDKRPSITVGGEYDVDSNFIPSYTAASESDGGMYLNAGSDIDVPVTTVTESSDVTSAYSNLINTDELMYDGYKLPINWRKVKIESDQGETAIYDDKNMYLLPMKTSKYNSKANLVQENHPTGGTLVKETFYFDLSGMQDIDTAASLLTWDSSTDKIQLMDYADYNFFASDVWTKADVGQMVESCVETLAKTQNSWEEIQSAWGTDSPGTSTGNKGWVTWQIVKQPSATTGDVLLIERETRYNPDWDAIKNLAPAADSPIMTKRTIMLAVGGGFLGLVGLIGAIIVYKSRKQTRSRGRGR